MFNTDNIKNDCPPLQVHDWPPVAPFDALPADFRHFLELDISAQQTYLTSLRDSYDRHGSFLNKSLGIVYAYVYSYKDSPCYLESSPMLETRLLSAKVILEEELIRAWLPPNPIPTISIQEGLVEYLREFTVSNPGVYHEFWDYIRTTASKEAMAEFLRLVLCRNEVVDDECALLICGLQGNMKKVMTSNLWDECGNGSLARFHTYWLRRMLEQTNDWDALPAYRAENKKPWCSGILSNVFNVLLTRPGYKYRAYGFFVTTESWVEPHFVRILDGLTRVGLNHEDIAVYFLAHTTIDIQHSQELLDALSFQTPRLTATEISEVLHGAHHAMSGALCQYQSVMDYMRSIDELVSVNAA